MTRSGRLLYSFGAFYITHFEKGRKLYHGCIGLCLALLAGATLQNHEPVNVEDERLRVFFNWRCNASYLVTSIRWDDSE
ncbi:hypothetical protein P692DRAFT_20930844 [Suillus brevipes Sb2]|nr:hypothetical protein P692DRAFT_20930844 [Suillus brevipes Sb2]